MSSDRGFTLIETLVSLVIFLLIALGVTMGLQHAVDGNVFDSQRQDVLNKTQELLDSAPPSQLCPAAGGTNVVSATTYAGLAFTIDIQCNVDNVPMPYPTATMSVPVTQVTATANWTTFGVPRSVVVQQ